MEHVKLEVFAFDQTVPHIAKAIIESAHTGATDDGFLAILPVDEIYNIRTMKEVETGDLCCRYESGGRGPKEPA